MYTIGIGVHQNTQIDHITVTDVKSILI